MANDFIQYCELYHHGIKGQRWGKRNGPPYPLDYDDHSKREKMENDLAKSGKSLSKKEKKELNKYEDAYDKRKAFIKKAIIALGVGTLTVGAIAAYKRYSKKYVDTVLKSGDKINTLMKNPDRLISGNRDYLFEAHDFWDRHLYRSRFGKVVTKVPVYDKSGKIIRYNKKVEGFKTDVRQKLLKNMKIASEDSSARSFVKLYRNNSDFKKYIDNAYKTGGMDMTKFSGIENRLVFPGFKEANNILKNKSGNFSDKDLKKVYRIFNYNMMNQDSNAVKARTAFFNELKNNGYSGFIDVNDSLYGGYQTNASNVIFDMNGLVLDKLKTLNSSDLQKSAIIDGANMYKKFGLASALGASTGIAVGSNIYYDKKLKKYNTSKRSASNKKRKSTLS